jgi:hypothetical protein
MPHRPRPSGDLPSTTLHLPRSHAHPARAAAALVLLTLSVCGCSSTPDAPDSANPSVPTASGNATSATGAPPGVLPDEPAVTNRVGVEIRSWIVNDREGDIARALRPLEIEQPGGTGTQASAAADFDAWKRAGLRVFRVNRAELLRVQAELSPRVGVFSLDAFDVGQRVSSAPVAVQRQWLEQGSRWNIAARGPELAEGGVIALNNSRAAVPPGALRLLARCWPVPVPGDSGVEADMRVQLVPQHDAGRQAASDLLAPRTTTADVTLQGQVFRGLLLTLTLKPGEAVLIVPESPARSWQEVIDRPPEEPPVSTDAMNATEATAPAAAPIARLGEVRRDGATSTPTAGNAGASPTSGTAPNARRGPDDGPVRSLGEEMLTARGASGGARVLIAIVPELPGVQRSSESRRPAATPSSPPPPALPAPASRSPSGPE